MQQVQINILQIRLLQTLYYTVLGILVVDLVRRDFGSVEELLAQDPGFQHPRGGGSFVAVDGCRIDVAVAGGDGVVGHVFCDGLGGLVDAWRVVSVGFLF